jgi:DNA-binding GntR family transcriptional regulator
MNAVQPLQFATKAEAVYGEIRGRILSGALKPGTPLNQDALAPELGVSVTPLREAVRRLEAEGLLQFEAHKTVIVSPLTRNELSEIYDVRLRLDPYAAGLATNRVTASDIREIMQMARIEASADPREQAGINRAFHRSIYSRSGNALMTDILDRLWERTDRYRILLVSTEIDIRAVAREHLEIVAAIKSGRAGAVSKLIHVHVAKARASIESSLD